MREPLARADASDGLQCSFCGRIPEDGGLVTAPEVAICAECVARAADLLEDDPEDDEASAAPRRDARRDHESVRVRLIGEADVATLLSVDDLIGAMKEALIGFSAGAAVQPVRLVLPLDDARGFLGAMPAYLREPQALGTKLVTVFPGNADRSLPTHAATIVLFDPRTGRPVSVMDGRLITEMRTAAASAVDTDRLARPDAAVLALLGSGVQAGSHLEALPEAEGVRRLDGLAAEARGEDLVAAERDLGHLAGDGQTRVRTLGLVVVVAAVEVRVGLDGAEDHRLDQQSDDDDGEQSGEHARGLQFGTRLEDVPAETSGAR